MNRLEKLKNELAKELSLGDEYGCYSDIACIKGFEAASAEYEKIIAELEGALKQCKINAMNERGDMYVALYPQAEKALQKLEEFRCGE